MRKWLPDVVLAVLMVWSVMLLGALLYGNKNHEENISPTLMTQESSEALPETIGVLVDGKVEEMELSEYLTGVLLCELPADFHLEAKKAQAIVARTYAIRVARQGLKHGYGVVCGDPACCQGFTLAKDYIERWGLELPVEQAREAVENTENLVLTYAGQLIDATYFSCSGGQTEAALAVWGADVPYLQSVDSPGEENSGHYREIKTFSLDAFCDVLGVDKGHSPLLGAARYTEGGGVSQMEIGGTTFSGTALRSKLELRSTWFSMTLSDEVVTVITRGFGHRVGMSQYGADAMAKNGAEYDEILKHYYAGVDLESWE